MADSPVHEWIQEWQNIKPLDIKSYAANLMADHDTTAALLRVFEDPSLHHVRSDLCKLVSPIVHPLVIWLWKRCERLEPETYGLQRVAS